MRNAGAWLWVLLAALVFVAAAPLTSHAGDNATTAKKPKPDAGK
jgi:hypothetical protein